MLPSSDAQDHDNQLTEIAKVVSLHNKQLTQLRSQLFMNQMVAQFPELNTPLSLDMSNTSAIAQLWTQLGVQDRELQAIESLIWSSYFDMDIYY